MKQKKTIQIAVITVVGVWVFCLSTVLSVKLGNRMLAAQTTAPTVPPTVFSTTAPSTTEPTTTAPTTRLPVGGNIVMADVSVEDPEWYVEEQESIKISQVIDEVNKNNTTTKPPKTTKPKSNVPEGKTEIIKAYVDGINKLKASTDFSLYKDDKLNLTIDKMPAESIAKTMAESLMQQVQKKPITYNFTGGTDSATGLTPNAAIAPLNVNAYVEESAVSSAVVSETGDGGYKITLLLIPELQTYTTPAKNHSTMVEVVDITPYIPSGLTVNTLDMSYTDTKIEATFDKDGKILSMVHYLKVDEAVSNVSFLGFPVEVIVHGDFTSNYTFSY
ncbi:MAG: hypothetical protein E7543_05510 [Ruminococcaceae bacterium]|nr:hypothetical protein [Oscillospiraceae bacterium]